MSDGPRYSPSLPEVCHTLHAMLHRQNEQITERLEALQATTDTLVLKVGQWESNARLLRFLAVGLGATLVWFIDKGLWVKDHLERH